MPEYGAGDVRISIDTDQDTFESAVQAVHAAYGVDFVPAPTAAPHEGGDAEGRLPGNWTPARIKQLAAWLDGSDAGAAVRFIAHNAPAVDLTDAFAHMAELKNDPNFGGQRMGGIMSAIGHGRNHIGHGVGPIYDTDYSARKYRMDPRIAATLLEAFDSLDA